VGPRAGLDTVVARREIPAYTGNRTQTVQPLGCSGCLDVGMDFNYLVGEHFIHTYEGVSEIFRTESITK
jgi:hypothetical protein